MAETLDIAYLYARVCGAFSNMRLGDKAGELMQNSGGIVGLWRLLFDEEAPSIAEARLVFEAERRIIKRAIDNFVRLTKPFSDSSEFIRALISKYEISTIKSMLFRLRSGEPKPEATTYFSNIIGQALARWPRITDMFSDTPYSWLDSHWLDKIAMAENELDKQYYLELWKTALGLPRQKVGAIPELIRWEVIYQNIVGRFVCRVIMDCRKRILPTHSSICHKRTLLRLLWRLFLMILRESEVSIHGDLRNYCPTRQGWF